MEYLQIYRTNLAKRYRCLHISTTHDTIKIDITWHDPVPVSIIIIFLSCYRHYNTMYSDSTYTKVHTVHRQIFLPKVLSTNIYV